MKAKGEKQLNYLDLEGEIHDARNMADIATELVEELFSSRNSLGDTRYSIGGDELRTAVFAVYHTAALNYALVAKWKAIHESHD